MIHLLFKIQNSKYTNYILKNNIIIIKHRKKSIVYFLFSNNEFTLLNIFKRNYVSNIDFFFLFNLFLHNLVLLI